MEESYLALVTTESFDFFFFFFLSVDLSLDKYFFRYSFWLILALAILEASNLDAQLQFMYSTGRNKTLLKTQNQNKT